MGNHVLWSKKMAVPVLLASFLCFVTLTTGSDITIGSDVNKRAAMTADQLTALTNQQSAQLKELTTELATLQHEAAVKQAAIDTLSTRLKNQATLTSTRIGEWGPRERQIRVLDQVCRNGLASLINRTYALEHAIAFTVRFSEDSVVNHTVQVGTSHTYNLVFDYVQYQTGGDNYNTSTGFFTAPDYGHYMFFLTRSQPIADDCVEAVIKVNMHGWLASVTACPEGYTSAANMVFAWLRKGDKVNVQTQDQARIFGYIHTTFTGIKIGTHS